MNEKNYSVARVEQHSKASIGKSERHIERKNESYNNMNVDLSRTPMNVHFKSCGELTYNACLDKLVEEGVVSLRGLKKDAKVFDEMVFDVSTAYFEQYGGYEFARQFYEEVYRFAEKEYGQGNIISAVMHADELNSALTEQLGHPVYHYHMHVVALPVVEKEIRWSKRCKDPALIGIVKDVVHQISHSKKWASQKVTDENGHTQIVKSYSLLQDRFFEHMKAAGFEDFDRGERGSTAEHLSVIEYKTKKESERLAGFEAKQTEVLMEIDALTEKKEEASEQANAAVRHMNELAPKLENIDEFARKYSDDAERVLPEVGTLESAKSYREKKVKPLFEKLTKVLRGLYHAYLDLKQNFERLKEKYNRLQQKCVSLDQSFNRIRAENKELKSAADAYNTLCRGYGEEKIESKVKAIEEQEALEGKQRRAEWHRNEIEGR